MSESQEALNWLARQFARVGTEKLDTPVDDSSGCTHPADGVMWNEFNQVTQCHRCGAQRDGEADGS